MPSATLPDFDAATLTAQPIERAETILASWYKSPTFHEYEREEGMHHFQSLLKRALREVSGVGGSRS